jgi:hypothetical protein
MANLCSASANGSSRDPDRDVRADCWAGNKGGGRKKFAMGISQ